MFKIKDNNLFITIPLKKTSSTSPSTSSSVSSSTSNTRYNCYMESKENPDGIVGEMDNIVGIIDKNSCGFGFWIDMAYKGKNDQNTSILFYWLDEQDSFEKFCKNNNISIIKIF